MKLEELQSEWERDSEINPLDLDTESLKTSKIHSKYIKHLIQAKLKLSALRLEYRELRQKRFRYYRGEMHREELKELNWDQFQGVKPIKNVMDELIEGDELLNRINIKVEYMETMVYFLESIMSGIKSRGWDIRNAVDYRKFIAGN